MIGELIGAAGSLLGGLFGKSSADKAADSQLKANRENIAMQKEFAQQGIQWRVKDARDAGLSPLAALGANTISFSPSSVGISPDTSMATAVANAGQDIGRAVDATRTGSAKVDAYQKTLMDLSLQRGQLENELLATQIAKTRQPAVQAPMPAPDQRWLVDGQGQTQQYGAPVIPVTKGPLLETAPMQRTASDPGKPFMEPGAINDLGFARTSSGWAPVQSGDAKQRLEDDLIGDLSWSLRNRIAPTIGFNNNPPFAAPKGKFWWYEPFMQEYQLKDVPGGR